MATHRHGSREYWVCQFVGWSIEGYGLGVNAIEGWHLPSGRAIADVIALCLAGMASTHLLRLFMQQRSWAGLPMRTLIPRCIGVSVLVGALLAAFMHFLSISAVWGSGFLHVDTYSPPVSPLLLGLDSFLLRLINLTIITLVWLMFYFSVTLLRDRWLGELRQAALQNALQVSKLRLLKSQLNPHFLFNSLNCLRALIPGDPARAQDAVAHLARTLRYALGTEQGELVTLRSELAAAQDYLALETLRFSERLRVELDISREAQEILVPMMLLQTVVENAITHGVAVLPQGGIVRISAHVVAGTLHIRVENPRSSESPSESESESPADKRTAGTGLRNCRERLQLLFGTRANIELDLSQQDCALTRISIPQHP